MLRLAARAARSAGWLSRRLGRGGGTTLPGVVLLKLHPNAVAELGQSLPAGSVLISATNGKTTTTRLVVAAAESRGLRVVTNAEGSNLERGVATALLDANGADIGIFEVDEAALPAVARALKPRTLVLMNLFRDQLDRYGELDTLLDTWSELLDELHRNGGGPRIVLNADDPNLAHLGRGRDGVVWFGVDDTSHALDERAHAADATTCRRCGQALEHDVVLLGHLGHWRCSTGDACRPKPKITAMPIELHADGQRITLGTAKKGRVTVESKLVGLHNSYNLTAAAAAAVTLPGEGSIVELGAALGSTDPAFGRGERVRVGDRNVHLLLAKNPTGVNQNIRTVLTSADDLHVMAMLNDRTADGQDVSWIWDVDWERLHGRLARLTLSGDRAHDLALRFRYGGFDMTKVIVEPDLRRALDDAVAATPADQTLHVLPTYTAMLDVRSLLVDRGLAQAYWAS